MRTRQGPRRTLNGTPAGAEEVTGQLGDLISESAQSALDQVSKKKDFESAGEDETEAASDPFEAFLEHPRRQFSIYGSKARTDDSGDNYPTNYV